MSTKRLTFAFRTLVVLLCLAGILMLLMGLLPEEPALGAAMSDHSDTQATSADAPVSSAKSRESLSGASAVRAQLVVAHIPQDEELPSGCEIISLCAALRALGYDAVPRDLVDNHLNQGTDYATQYVGSPDTDGGGLPPCIVDAANSWLEANGLPATACDVTGTTFSELLDMAAQGHPVLVWTTEELGEPEFIDVPGEGEWYVSEHCVVLYGQEGDQVLVMNPLDVTDRYDRVQFQHIYEACGNRALVVIPQ